MNAKTFCRSPVFGFSFSIAPMSKSRTVHLQFIANPLFSWRIRQCQARNVRFSDRIPFMGVLFLFSIWGSTHVGSSLMPAREPPDHKPPGPGAGHGKPGH